MVRWLLVHLPARQAFLALEFGGGEKDSRLQEVGEKSPGAVFALKFRGQRGDERARGRLFDSAQLARALRGLCAHLPV